MNNTHQTKSLWRRTLTLATLVLLTPILFCEIYDYVPKRTWIYRQTHTIGFVDVTANLEVDGEQLTFTRTFRCIDQPKPWALNGATGLDATVFDALGGVSKSGRKIVVNVPKACSFTGRILRDRDYERGIITYNANLEPAVPLNVNRDPPVVLEVIGSRGSLEKVYSYSPEALSSNRYGVRLNELKITVSSKEFQLLDGDSYDWIGALGWYGGSTHHYRGYFGYELPADFLTAISPTLRQEIETCKRPCAISLTYKFAQDDMLKGYNYNLLERFPLEFDPERQFFRLHPDILGRLLYTDLPIGTNLGHWDDAGPYIIYKLGEEEVKAYQVRKDSFARFVFPGSNFVLAMSDGRLFYLPVSADGVNIRSYK